MDEGDTVEGAVKRKCPCGGMLRVVKKPQTTIVEIVCDSCNKKQ